MGPKHLLTLLVTAAFAVANATETATEYSAAEAARHIGENVTVTDKVFGVHVASGGNVFINLGGRHPDAPFTIFISAKVADQFSDVKSYENKTISVTGEITTHKEKAQISVTSPSQITVKEEGASSSPAAKTSPSPSPRR